MNNFYVGSNPTFLKSPNSSGVEQKTENLCVGGSSPPLGIFMFMNSIFFFNENNNLLSLSFANFGLLKSIYYFLLYTLFPSLLVGLSKIAEILIYSPLEIILPAGVTLASLSPFRLESLVDIACADYVQTQGRFLLFYPLLSHIFSLRVSVVTLAPDLK